MRAIFVAALLMLTGCAHVDTGEIDYRRAEPARDLTKSVGDYIKERCKPEKDKAKWDSKGKQVPPLEIQCEALLEARLFRKNATVGNAIAKGDVYSVRLEHGLVAYLTEAPFSLRRLVTGKDPFTRIGEIVILANLFEFSPADADETAVKGFMDFASFNDAKVIYYNPDVEQGQDLNFSNIPLQAPVEYQGRPIGIQIVVMELDRTSDQMRGLLKQLSLMGQESNILPGGPASSLLLELGTSLLTNQNDDVIFEYRFVLDPSNGTPGVQSAPFEAGRYVLRRSDDRLNDQNWRNLILDHNTGKLMWKSPPADDIFAFERDTYFTINVIKHPDKTAAAAFGFKTMKQLSDQITAAANDRDAPLQDLTKGLQENAERMRTTKWGADLAAAWEATAARATAYGRIYPDRADTTGCKLIQSSKENAQLAEVKARLAAITFIRLFEDARAATDAKQDKLFKERDQLKILDSLSAFFVPANHVSVAQLTDPEAFATEFVQKDTSRFQDAVINTAREKFAPTDCAGIRTVGLADDQE